MRKTIIIDGKSVELKTNGIVPIMYKKEFKRDFFADIFTLQGKSIDAEVIYNLIWTFARIADESIPDMWEWAAQFESFPVAECMSIATQMVTACIATSRPEDEPDKNSSKKKKKSS